MDAAPIRSYRDLLVWRKGVELAVHAHRFCIQRTRPHSLVLMQQLERSAMSIPANIAEGYGRGSRGDYVRFVCIANGSLKELETHLLLARQFDPAWADEVGHMLEMTDEIGRMLVGLMRALRRARPKP
ncbi:MAG TPA: four helix bundle protein [Gemmatimonadales bacterium]